MHKVALFIVLSLTGRLAVANEPVASDLLKRTLACHDSYKNLGDPMTYEVFEQEGLTFARSVEKNSAGHDVMTLSMTDGIHVYRVDNPVKEFYWKNQDFRIEFPASTGRKALCVSYHPNAILRDEVSQFAPTPPAQCPHFPTRTTVVVTGSTATKQIEKIQDRIISHIRMQSNIGIYLLEHPGVGSGSDRQLIERTNSFNPRECAKLDRLSGALIKFEEFRKKAAGTLVTPRLLENGKQ